MAVEHYSLAISWRYPSYWTILINWIFISAKLINCYDKWFEGRTCRPPSTLLLNIFFFHRERLLSFISVICLWNKTQDSLNPADERLACGLTHWCGESHLASLLHESLPKPFLFDPIKSCKQKVLAVNGCQGRWMRNTYRFLTVVIPRKALRGIAWIWFSLRSLEREREMRKTKRDIRICLKPLHILVESILRKMDGLLLPHWNDMPQLWSLRPNCSTDHKCHILLYSSGLLSIRLCVRLMKNISKAALCNERSQSGIWPTILASENITITCALSNPRKQIDKYSATPKLTPAVFNACLWTKWILTCHNGCA